MRDAIEKIAEHIFKTGKSAADAVRFMWGRLELTEEDLESLAQEALRVRVCERVSGRRVHSDGPQDGGLTVRPSIRLSEVPEGRHISVSCVLSETWLETEGGARKPMVSFTVSDCQYYVNRQMDIEAGSRRHRMVMEHAQRRLKALGRKTIADLGPGEQDIIARAWQDARDGKETREFERFQKKAAQSA